MISFIHKVLKLCTQVIVVSGLLTACVRPTNLGQQYRDGRLHHVFNPVTKKKRRINTAKNYSGFKSQLEEVAKNPEIKNKYEKLYTKVSAWHDAGGLPENLYSYNIHLEQMRGTDGYGNVLFTGYYSPILTMSKIRTETYKYPVHRKPEQALKDQYPTRAEIYAGAFESEQLEIGYSTSLLDTFLMQVQGSGFAQFNDSDKIIYLGYGGQNRHPYVSIGKILIDRQEISKEAMSANAIREWAARQDEPTLIELLNQNTSYVFFSPQETNSVIGTACVPLLAGATVAADPSYLPMGSVLLAEVPQIDHKGQWTGQHILKLLIVLDTGGAIKENHIDLYCGIGEEAGVHAGYLKHYGRVWRLNLVD